MNLKTNSRYLSLIKQNQNFADGFLCLSYCPSHCPSLVQLGSTSEPFGFFVALGDSPKIGNIG